jgi:hypothetical protein
MGAKLDKPRCPHCGSPDLLRDAWACWSVEEQAWVLHSTYDTFYCEQCSSEVRNPICRSSEDAEQE